MRWIQFLLFALFVNNVFAQLQYVGTIQAKAFGNVNEGTAYNGKNIVYTTIPNRINDTCGILISTKPELEFGGLPLEIAKMDYSAKTKQIYAVGWTRANLSYFVIMDDSMKLKSATLMGAKDAENSITKNSVTASINDGTAYFYLQSTRYIYHINTENLKKIDSIAVPYKFAYLKKMALDRQGNFYFFYEDNWLEKYNKNLKLIKSFGGFSDFNVINDSVIAGARAYRVDYEYKSEFVYYNTNTGADIKKFQMTGNPMVEGFFGIGTVIVLESGNILAQGSEFNKAQQSSSYIWYKIDKNGKWLDSYPVMLSKLIAPELVAVDKNGNIYTNSSHDDKKVDGNFYGPGIFKEGPYMYSPTLQYIKPVGCKLDPVYRITNIEGASGSDLFRYSANEAVGFRNLFGNANYPAVAYEYHDVIADFVYMPDSTIYFLQSLAEAAFLKHDLKTKKTTPFGKKGNDIANGEVYEAKGIAVNKLGEVIITDVMQHKVQVYSGTGEFLRLHNTYGELDNEVKAPVRVVVDKYDNIFISEAWNHRIKITDRLGNLIGNFGSYGTGNENFKYPADLAIDTIRNQLIVADRNNNRVQIFKIKYPMTVKPYFKAKGSKDVSAEINVFPNPFKNRITINSVDNINSIILFDQSGRVLYKKVCDDLIKNQTVEIPSSIIAGKYILKIETNSMVYNKLIIKL